MNWKRSLQIGDLDPGQRLEITCRQCGHVHYLTREAVIAVHGRATLYLDEIERLTGCKARGCQGQVRLAMTRKGDTSGFVGGMA